VRLKAFSVALASAGLPDFEIHAQGLLEAVEAAAVDKDRTVANK
jgi:hypothetical protein